MFLKNKVWMMLAVVMVLSLLAIGGCGEDVEEQTEAEEPVETDNGDGDGDGDENGEETLSGSIVTAGSTSVQPVSELLAEGFMSQHPEVSVDVQGGGSTAGVVAAEDGTADIGGVSRELADDEQHLNDIVIGIDGIAVVVHPDNPVEELELEEVRQIFTKEITNWSEVGGPDIEINAVTREEGSGTRGAFESMVMGDEEISQEVVVQDSTGACRTTVEGDENAISYISLAAMVDDVKALAVDGAEPTVENIVAGDYEIARPFNYVVDGEPEGLVKEFIDFVLSEEGQEIVEEAGLISAQ